MNHGPAFQALWSQLRTEVRQLQDKGYYGDGKTQFCVLCIPMINPFLQAIGPRGNASQIQLLLVVKG